MTKTTTRTIPFFKLIIVSLIIILMFIGCSKKEKEVVAKEVTMYAKSMTWYVVLTYRQENEKYIEYPTIEYNGSDPVSKVALIIGDDNSVPPIWKFESDKDHSFPKDIVDITLSREFDKLPTPRHIIVKWTEKDSTKSQEEIIRLTTEKPNY
ncbi:hypothetical protein [Paenibacillus chitinolyticus]